MARRTGPEPPWHSVAPPPDLAGGQRSGASIDHEDGRTDRLARQARRVRDGRADLGLVVAGIGGAAALAVLARQRRARRREAVSAPARKVRQGAALLGASVLADSALEHFRGGFHNPAMFLAPAMGAVAIASSLAEPPGHGGRAIRAAGHGSNVAAGAAGLGFHIYNILRRPGGASWNNLFYAAPLGAPGALSVAGLLNIGANAIDRRLAGVPQDRRHDLIAGRSLGMLTGVALLAESAEVALLHFRGAYHNPAMFLPVTIPPAAAAALLHRSLPRTALPRASLRPPASRRPRPAMSPLHRPRGGDATARALLKLTGALGLIGTGFHVYGVGRNMGGWRNWRQNVQAGPPVPAPISFTGLALAGLAALDLMQRKDAE